MTRDEMFERADNAGFIRLTTIEGKNLLGGSPKVHVFTRRGNQIIMVELLDDEFRFFMDMTESADYNEIFG